MTTPITLDDIYGLFRASQEDLLRSRAEFDRRMAESDRRMADFDRQLAQSRADFDREIAQSRADFDRQVAQSRADFAQQMAESNAKFDRQMAESKEKFDREMAQSRADFDRRIAKLEKTVERTSRAVDALTTRWGRFVESLVEPAVLHLFQSRGIEVTEIHPRVHTKRDGLAMEIDILAVNDTDLVLVECKSRLSLDDVNEFLEKLGRFKQAFPHYGNYNAYGAVAGIEVNEGVDRYAYRQGLFVIKPAGDSVAIVNDPGFRPRSW
jgi:hypothetical protein